MKKYLVKNWHLILAGIALTAFAVPHTYGIRGYFAIGGEWLILPVILMAARLVDVVIQDIFQIVSFEEFEGIAKMRGVAESDTQKGDGEDWTMEQRNV